MFCPRCGAASAPEAAFCEACGERLTEPTPTAEQPTPIPPPTAEPAAPVVASTPSPGGGRRGWWIGAGVAVLAAGAVVAVLALTGSSKSPTAHRAIVARPVPVPAPVTAETTAPPAETTATPTTATETTPAAPKSEAVAATVARTCGAGGVGGDCHLSVRSRPSSGGAELERLDEGDALRVTCQVRGDAVTSSALGASSTVWSRTTHGGYVSNVYVKGPGLKATRRTLPAC